MSDAEKKPEDETAEEEAPAEETPAEEAPAEEPAAEEEPAEEAPAEEVAAEEPEAEPEPEPEPEAEPEPEVDETVDQPVPFADVSSVPPADANVKRCCRIRTPGPTLYEQILEFLDYVKGTWFQPGILNPSVEALIYWRDPTKSGIVFGIGLVTLLAISCFSVISVIAYLSLTLMIGTIGFRIYKNVLGALQKSSEGHPFKEYLETDITISQEKGQELSSVAVAHMNAFVTELRRLFLVQDLLDSMKFAVILWVFTYIGSWFNGMTIVTLVYISLFTLPKVYEQNKEVIDKNLEIARVKIMEITDKVKAAVPASCKVKSVADEDKDK